MQLHRLHGCPVVVHADFPGFCFSRTSASFLNSCWNISLPGVRVDGEVLKRQRAAGTRTWADISALPPSASPSTSVAVACALETGVHVHVLSVWTHSFPEHHQCCGKASPWLDSI